MAEHDDKRQKVLSSKEYRELMEAFKREQSARIAAETALQQISGNTSKLIFCW